MINGRRKAGQCRRRWCQKSEDGTVGEKKEVKEEEKGKEKKKKEKWKIIYLIQKN